MHAPSPLLPTVILLTAGVLGLAVAKFAKISPIVGFFILGAAIGPQMLGLIESNSSTLHFLGELGISFLLFDIGLHLSLKELRHGWRSFVFSGALQAISVTGVISLVLRGLGLEWVAACVLGAILSLSSTALVLKILSDEKEESSPVGKRATEVLVFQDITAILLLVVLAGDLSAGVSFSSLALPILKMLGAAAFFVLIGKFALKPLFKLLISFKSDEVITAFALLLVFVAAAVTQQLGLSLALGAFLGGLSLSESSYSYLVRGEVAPFRSLLLSLFFLSVGINLDVLGMMQNVWLLITLLGIFAVTKVAGNFIAFRIAGMERGISTLLSFLLAQGSEFAFVLLGLAASTQLIDSTTLSLSISLVGISLAFTPVLASIGCLFSRSVCQVHAEADVAADEEREVIIVRMDEFGRQLATLLESERIPYRGHDLDLERLAYAKSRGLNVYYSDLNRPRTLGRVSLGKALAVVSLVEEDEILLPLIEGLKKVDGGVPVLAATENPTRLERLTSLGIERAFIKSESSMIAVFEAVIRAIGYDEVRIESAVKRALLALEPEGLYPQMGNAFQPQLQAQLEPIAA